jgi:hypothetical protein
LLTNSLHPWEDSEENMSDKENYSNKISLNFKHFSDLILQLGIAACQPKTKEK